MKVNLFVVFLFYCCFVISGQELHSVATSYMAGGVSVVNPDNWQSFHNPALLVMHETVSASVVYENRFGMKELSTKMVSLALPLKQLHVGVATSGYGFGVYSESLTGITFARSFDDKFSLGVQMNYYSATLSNSIGHRGVVLAQVGLCVNLSSAFCVGFNTFNPTRQKLKYNDIEKQIPSLFSIGSSLKFSDEFLWLFQLDKEMSSSLVWRGGFEYYPLKEIRLRLGASGSDFTPTLGCGMRWKTFLFDVNFVRHPVLGISSVGMLRYSF